MNEKNKKEILTKDKIKLDLMVLLKREQMQSIWILVLMPILLFLSVFLIINIRSYPWERIEYILYSILAIVGLIHSVVLLRKVIIGKRRVKNAEFDVEEDTLVDSTLDARTSRSPNIDRHLLQFARCGEYYIPYGTNYNWSKDYYMSDRGVFNTSLNGDSFYIVTYQKDKKRKPIIVYNTKLFELRDEEAL